MWRAAGVSGEGGRGGREWRSCGFLAFAFGGKDFLDEGDGGGWGVGEVEAVAEEGFGGAEEVGVGGEEGDEGLAGGEVVAEFGVEFDAGVRVDGGSGDGAAGAEAVDGPADGGGVHG